MAILTEAGRIAVAQYISEQPLHMGWGNGDPVWDTLPEPESPGLTQLVAEVGRRLATNVRFALPDSDGEIALPEGNFAVSPTPTKYLLLNFDFDYGDAVGQDIREHGIFVGTVTNAGVPPETPYLVPSQIDDPGRMLVVERVAKYPRTNSTRQRFTYVIQF